MASSDIHALVSHPVRNFSLQSVFSLNHMIIGDFTMRKSALILASVALIGSITVAAPAPAQARGGFLPALAGGLIASAIIGGIASDAYGYNAPYAYYQPGYRPYYPRPYYAGYAPAYGGYGGYGYGRSYYRPFGYRYAAPKAYYPRYAYRSYRAPVYGYYRHRHPTFTYAAYGSPHRNWRAGYDMYRGPHHLHHVRHVHHARHRH